MKRNSKAALIVAVVIAFIVVVSLLMNQAHSESHWEDGHMHMMNFGGWGWFMMPLMIVFWGLIIWGVVWATGAFFRNDDKRDDSAMELLKKRYAAGEISREEFESKRRHLS